MLWFRLNDGPSAPVVSPDAAAAYNVALTFVRRTSKRHIEALDQTRRDASGLTKDAHVPFRQAPHFTSVDDLGPFPQRCKFRGRRNSFRKAK
jgi:hypothetical protein